MTGIGPTADNGLCHGSDVAFVYNEVRPIEERGYCATQEHRTENAVDDEERLEGASTQNVAQLVLELVANGLYNKREKYDHPKPIGSAETGAVKQGERSKEASTEHHQCGEGEFPLTTSGIDHQPTFVLGFAEGEYKGVGSLNKHQEHEQRP